METDYWAKHQLCLIHDLKAGWVQNKIPVINPEEELMSAFSGDANGSETPC